MGIKKSDIDESDVIDKLDKVADTLETASSQLSGVVTQQQLDLVLQRLAGCESALASTKDGIGALAQQLATRADESASINNFLNDKIVTLEKEFSGLRALTLSSFALATIALIGLIILGAL